MLDKLKTALVLVVIGAISGLLIFGTNALTEEGIAANKLEKEQGFYRQLFDIDDSQDITTSVVVVEEDVFEEITITDSSDTIIGYIYKGNQTNNYGDVTVLVGINLSGEITEVIISSTTNTPTFVNIINTEYIMNFSGQSFDDVNYDARTGASYTYGSVSQVVEDAVTYYEANRGDMS
jgi:electron transport complex protein RnfG